MGHKTILIIGDHEGGFPPHDALLDSVRHAAQAQGLVVNTRWFGNDELATRPWIVTEVAGIVVAPRSSRPRRVFPAPMIQALRTARERSTPVLATGDGADLYLIELARDLLGITGAGSTFYDEALAEPVIKELAARDGMPARRKGTLDLVMRVDSVLGPWMPAGRREESLDITHALNPDYVAALEEAGLHTAGVDALGGRPFLFTLPANAWHVAAAFLPQLRSRDQAPHPLFTGLVAHAAGSV